MQILAVIKKHGYRLEDVATMLGITKGSLSATINGSPNVKKLIDIALKIGCSPAEFFDDWYENEGREQQRPAEPEPEVTQHQPAAQQPAPADELPYGEERTEHQQNGAEMIGLFRCPKCGHSIRLFAETEM